MADAGKIAPTYENEWSASVAYDFHSYVTHNGNCYIAKQPSTGVEPVDEENEYWFLALKNVSAEELSNLRKLIEELINGTTPVGKAKDSDTVDDYHASDFILGSPSKSNITSTFTFQNLMHKCETEKRAIFFTNWTDGKNFPYVYGSGIVIPAYDARFYLILYGRTASDETSSKFATATVMRSNDVYTAIWDEKANKDEVLPLTGGTLSGDLTIDKSEPRAYMINNVGDTALFKFQEDGNLGISVTDADGSSCAISLMPSKGIGKMFRVVENGTVYTGLHTGNSNAVIKSTTAPSDTTAVWADTTNNKIKIYKDGAWTALA